MYICGFCGKKFNKAKSMTNHQRWHKEAGFDLAKFRKKQSESKLGEKNPQWKGDNVSYHSLHDWIKRHKPKLELCECCNEKSPYDLANKDHKYKRDINDFRWLCRECHMKYDYEKGFRNKRGENNAMC